MVINITEQYDTEKKQYLSDLWEKVVVYMGKSHDHKKMLSFLSKAGIIAVEDEDKTVYIGVPNEFVLIQVKKFFLKALKEAVHEVYNPQYVTKLEVYPVFQTNGVELQCDLKKVLRLKETKKQQEAMTHNSMQQDLTAYFGILFDPVFRFDNFVAGSHNNFAFSAAQAVAESPGTVYNPLFLYGNVGLGKTHLMQAIGNTIMQTFPDKVVLYLPASKLIDEIVSATRKNKLTNLIKKFESVDVLLVDDIQFLADKEKTQEIFHNIFNDFHMKKKQVILTSDRPPKELVNIAARLKSRFGLGLVADIQAPDYETRLAILHAKLVSKDEDIDNDHLGLIAKYVKNNVRELEGALNILLTRKKMTKQDITEHDVLTCLKTLGYSADTPESKTNRVVQSNTRSTENFSNLVDMVAQYYNIGVAELKSDSRKKDITTSRQILMLLAKKYFHWTLEKIGDYFGGKNHASVIYAINNIEKKLKTDSDMKHDYQVFVDWLEN